MQRVMVTMHRTTFVGAALLAAALLAGCSDETPSPGSAARAPVPSNVDEIPPRWYTTEDVARGGAIFARHCASCHGADAAGASAVPTAGSRHRR